MPSSTLFSGIGRLVTLEQAAKKQARHVTATDLSIVEDAALVSVNGKVAWAGPRKDLPKRLRSEMTQTVKLNGATVVPAFIESHTHLIFAGNRAEEFNRRLRGESYQSIAKSGGGILSTVSRTRKSSEAELVRSGQERVNRFISQGVGTIEVKSGYGLSTVEEMKILKAAKKLKKARIVSTFLGAHALSPEFKTFEDYIDHLTTVALPKIKKAKLAERVDIFIETGFFTPEIADKYLRRARELGFSIAVHADQLSLSGGSLVAVNLGANSAEHLIKIGEKEIKALSKSETTCVLLPSSDLYMKCDYPPARRLIDSGARVALATDFNPGSSPSQDIALVGLLARLEMGMTFAEVLCAYTIGAAHALGLADEIGSIEMGKSCDFAVLDGDLEELFYSVGHTPVRSLYMKAKPVRI
jgi:imidazolonepropionase